MNKYLDETGLAYFWGKIKSAMPAAQVQADWNQTNTSAADYIKNKPSIPTIPDLAKGTTTGNGNAVTDISVSGHTITLTKGTTFLTSHQDISGKQDKVAKLGSSTKPLYTSAAGTFSECSTYAGGTNVTLNGSNKSGSTASFYAPTVAGTSGQYLVSGGSGTAPSWSTLSSYAGGTAVTLNGTSKAASTASFYAPTGGGTSGYLLVAGGSSTAPSWKTIADAGVQAKVGALGSTTKPVYTSAAGTFAECSAYAGGTAVTLNGTNKAASTASLYAPTTAGTSGQILTSNGSGAPSWANKPSYAYTEISYPVNTTTANGLYTGNITIDGTKPLHVITITGDVTVTLSANPSDGHSSHVIFTSTAARTITINHDSTSRVCPEAKNVALSLTANGYVEVDFLSANSKVFVRGV